MRGRRTMPNLRLTHAALAICSGLAAGLGVFSYRLTKRYGRVLLQLEAMEDQERPNGAAAMAASEAESPVAEELRQQQLLFERGMPAGSVAMNFELTSLAGEPVTLTAFRGSRVLLIFISAESIPSISMLPGIAQLSNILSSEMLSPIIIASGDVEQIDALIQDNGITLPVLLQTTNEASQLYYVDTTPVAYLVDEDGITVLDRIDGPQSILGVLASAGLGVPAPQTDTTSSEPVYAPRLAVPRIGDPFPAIDLPLLDGGRLTNDDLFGIETLLVFFDPHCVPCLDLLPDLARVQANPTLPNVVMITRRDGELTRNLQEAVEMPYPIARQEHWDLSRHLGVLAVPVAWLIHRDGCLAAGPAVGQEAVQQMIVNIPESSGPHRTVSLTSLLRQASAGSPSTPHYHHSHEPSQ